jgi:methylmalonyl-CoA mutase C-terminal domain/subunit
MIERLRILLSRDDELHTRGYFLLARLFREQGWEVILGGVQTPREIATTALAEDVDLIGYHIMTGAPEILVPSLVENLKALNCDKPIVVGGIIPPQLIPQLKALGVKEIFTPGSSLDAITRCIGQLLSPKTLDN